MSIIRLSTLRTKMHAPDRDGNLVPTDYDPGTLQGALGDFTRPPEMPPPSEDDVATPHLDDFLERSLKIEGRKLKAGAPVLCMVHGFLFDPKQVCRPNPADTDNPHGRLYHFNQSDEATEIKEHTTGWPRQLEFAPDDGGAGGIAVAFGWHSQPGFASSLLERFENFYARAYDYGTETAWPLVLTLRGLTRLITDRPIDILCHSMGSTVVIRALAIAAKYRFPLVDRIGRVIILGGSEYTGEANILYKRVSEHVAERKLKRGQGPYVYNVVSRENDVLDKLAENFGPKTFFSDTQVVGHNGLESAKGADRWMDLQIDGGDMRVWARKAYGLDISGDQAGNIWDHWYYYTHRGNMAMYRQILRKRADWSFEVLRSKKKGGPVPEGVAVGFFGD